MHFKLIMARLGDMKAVVRTKYLIVVLVVTTRDVMAITPKICFDEKNDAFVGVLMEKDLKTWLMYTRDLTSVMSTLNRT